MTEQKNYGKNNRKIVKSKKSVVYQELLQFSSIKKYLDKAIGKKKGKISGDLTVEDKIQNINLVAYLRGIKVFFDYSKLFQVPSDIIDYWNKYRDNQEKIDALENEIENYPNWLKSKKKLSDSTAITYQTHIRGFLTNNNIKLTFKNHKIYTLKSEQQDKLGITYEEMKSFAEKVKQFISDLELRLLCEFEHRTGLAFREIADITFGTLRMKDYNQEYIMIGGFREKTTVKYYNFISPALKEYISAFLNENKDKPNEEKIFTNDIKQAYQRLNDRFNTAYVKCCNAYFERFLTVKSSKGKMKKLFSLHSFRSVFKNACDNLRIIPEHRDLFIAHTSDKMINYDLKSDILLRDYKIIENELFGKKSSNESDTIDQVFEILKELIADKGKTKAIYRKYQENPNLDMNTEIRGALYLEQFKQQLREELKTELLNEFKTELNSYKNELESYKKDIISKISLKDLLLASQ